MHNKKPYDTGLKYEKNKGRDMKENWRRTSTKCVHGLCL